MVSRVSVIGQAPDVLASAQRGARGRGAAAHHRFATAPWRKCAMLPRSSGGRAASALREAAEVVAHFLAPAAHVVAQRALCERRRLLERALGDADDEAALADV